ncbi:MAG: hypothetical protein ACI83B_003580 [Sediminicola sp.]
MYNDYRPSGLLMDSIERSSLVSKYSYSQSVINELRAGDSRVTQAAWLLITIWMLQQESVGFQPVRQAPMPPHLESARNLLFGKQQPDQFFCRGLSMSDSRQFGNQNVNSNEYKVYSKMSPTLLKVSNKIRKDEDTRKGLDNLQEQLKNGELHAGREAKKLPGTKTVFYMRAGGEARLNIQKKKKEP